MFQTTSQNTLAMMDIHWYSWICASLSKMEPYEHRTQSNIRFDQRKKTKLRTNMAPPKVEDSTIGTGDSTWFNHQTWDRPATMVIHWEKHVVFPWLSRGFPMGYGSNLGMKCSHMLTVGTRICWPGVLQKQQNVIQADSPVMLFSQWENNNIIFNKSRFSKNYLDSNLVPSPQKKANVHCW